jgi:hypothetical protein
VSVPPLSMMESDRSDVAALVRTAARVQELELRRLRRENIEKDVEIARLTRALTDRGRDMDRMSAAVAELQQQLGAGETAAVMQLRAATRETERALAHTLRGREAEVAALQDEKTELLREMSGLVAVMHDQARIIANLRAEARLSVECGVPWVGGPAGGAPEGSREAVTPMSLSPQSCGGRSVLEDEHNELDE